MKEILIFLILILYIISFSQENKKCKKEISVIYGNKQITEGKNYDNTRFTYYDHQYGYYLGIKNKIFTKFEIIGVAFIYQFKNNLLKNSIKKYSSTQIDIPIDYSVYFFKKTWFNPNIGFTLNNNLIFNEEIDFSYLAYCDKYGCYSHREQNETKFRYQIAFAVNAGLSFVIKKRYTINISGFVNLLSNYKLNPLGEEKLPYSLYGYSFGLGYRF